MPYNKVTIALIALLGMAQIAVAQYAEDSASLQGSWMLSGVHSELFLQQGNSLLEKKDIYGSTQTTFRVPVRSTIIFREDSCLIMGRISAMQKYTIGSKGLLMITQQLRPDLPAVKVPCQYKILASGKLIITMPAVQYQDPVRNQPVKMVYQCQYLKN